MKILYFDCFAGISGDMTLGALVDLGVDSQYLLGELDKLSIADEFEIKVYKTEKMGISGTKVDVIVKNDNDHSHDNHPNHDNNYGDDHDHHHRNLDHIREIINNSELSPKVKDLSERIFMEIALAEAKVHNKSIDQVHFHEVGAVDSIVDIVGAAICIDKLGVDQIISSTVEMGKGFVKCAHGIIPVPAPATIEILQNVPIHLGRIDGEATTPTGAAILKANVEIYTDEIDFSIDKIGYGVGTKDFHIPNLLRVYLGKKKLLIR